MCFQGSFMNVAYTLGNGETVKILNDEKIYLANQICKQNSDRFYGIAADENNILVCEYGENGSDVEVVVYKKRGK